MTKLHAVDFSPTAVVHTASQTCRPGRASCGQALGAPAPSEQAVAGERESNCPGRGSVGTPSIPTRAEPPQTSLLDLVHDPLVVSDINGVIVFWNRSAEEMYGWSREEALGKIAWDLLQTRFPTSLEAVKATVLSTGRWEGELIQSRRDGTPIVVGSRWALQRDEVGRPAAIVEVDRDISERKHVAAQIHQLNEALADRARELETLLQVLPIGIGIAGDPRCRDIRMNPAFVQMLGLSLDEHASKRAPKAQRPSSFTLYQGGKEVPAGKLPMQVAAAQGVEIQNSEFDIAYDDGTTRHMVAYAAPLLDAQGAVRGSVGAFIDITERKRMQAALQQSQERFRALVENSSDAFAVLSAEGLFIYASPSTHRILGYTSEELVGKSPFALAHPDDLGRVSSVFTWLLERQDRRATLEYRIQHKSGTWLWIEGVGTNLIAEPSVQGVVINYRDITQRKRHECEIETLNARLQRAMAETHHRVKNNLQVIASLVELETFEERQTVPIAAIQRIGRHVSTLAGIHEMLTQRAKTTGEAQSLSAKLMLESLVEQMQATIGDRRICCRIEALSLPVREVTALALLVNELLSNSVKHGGRQIALTLTREQNGARLEICDDGPGFPPGFDAKTAANTGLELVESVGRWDLRGTIAYQNRPEGGACVVVTFPLTRPLEPTSSIPDADP